VWHPDAVLRRLGLLSTTTHIRIRIRIHIRIRIRIRIRIHTHTNTNPFYNYQIKFVYKNIVYFLNTTNNSL
jgi:hypothetical protein